MKKIIPLAILTVTLGLAGCSAPEPAPSPAPVTVSAECTASVQKMKTETNQIYETATLETPADVLNAPSIYPLEDCASFAEYSKAGIANPGAWGMTRNSEDQMKQLVSTACYGMDKANTTPVCADAKALGLLS